MLDGSCFIAARGCARHFLLLWVAAMAALGPSGCAGLKLNDQPGETRPDARQPDSGEPDRSADTHIEGDAPDAADAESNEEPTGTPSDVRQLDAGEADRTIDRHLGGDAADIADAPGEPNRSDDGSAGGDAADAPDAESASILSGSPATSDVGNAEVGIATAPITWSITNTGSLATGSLSLTNDDPTEIAVTNGCTGPLAALASCTVTVVFMPSTGGPRAGTLTLEASPGGSVSLTVTAQGQYRLTAVKSGTGTIASTPGGIDCGDTCSALFNPGPVTLSPRTTNGSGFYFSGWSGGSCSGPSRTCTLTIGASTPVSATFSPMTANIIFMTSNTFPANLGGATAYDAKCNDAATAAGINDVAGGAYVAFISDAASSAQSRLGTARGWVRLDGKPFTDALASPLGFSPIFNSMSFDEYGNRLNGAVALTGTGSSGTLSLFDCASWTTNLPSMFAALGSSAAGPDSWFEGFSGTCDVNRSLICMGKTRSTAVGSVVAAGKLIWQSNTSFVPGGSLTPDAKCQAERPTGATAGVALIAFTNRTASAVLDPAAVYVRPDGTQVGTGAELAAGNALESGIWQSADGGYSAQLTWTGSDNPALVGTAASTCADWSDGAAADPGTTGWSPFDARFWWKYLSPDTCSTGHSLYCVEP